MYKAQFTADALEDIRGLPKNVKNALRKKFENEVLIDPTGCSEELTGPLAGFRSYHFRDFRVVYRVFDDLKAIAVVGVGDKDVHHQGQIYKKLEQLARTGKLADSVLRALRLFEG